jgi:hypothetical protein
MGQVVAQMASPAKKKDQPLNLIQGSSLAESCEGTTMIDELRRNSSRATQGARNAP